MTAFTSDVLSAKIPILISVLHKELAHEQASKAFDGRNDLLQVRCHPISFRSASKLKDGNNSKPKLLWISKVKKGYPDLKEKNHYAQERIQTAIFRLISPGDLERLHVGKRFPVLGATPTQR